MTLLDRVKKLCKEKGISQGKMEKEIGISNGASSKWKTSSPSLEILKKLSNYFGVTVDYLMNGDETVVNDSYYLNEETAKLAQEMFEDSDMRSLFDMKRKMDPERFKAHVDFMKQLYEKENGEN